MAGQGLCPWNPLGEMISPSPPHKGYGNFKVKMLWCGFGMAPVCVWAFRVIFVSGKEKSVFMKGVYFYGTRPE
jgi:hypothetical protein